MAEDQFIFTTDIVEKVREKFEDGFKCTRQEKYWFGNLPLVRRSGLVFSFSDEELLEYTKCKFGIDVDGNPYVNHNEQILKQSGIQYFSEKYCRIKNEVGKISNMRLRLYQNDILDLYIKNRFSILVGSRQIGKCVNYDTEVFTFDGVTEKIEYIFEIWYNSLKTKTIIDKIKHYLYKALVRLN